MFRLLLAAVLLAACASETPRPSASPVAPASPAATARTVAAVSERFGFIALTRDGFVVRRETDPEPIRRIEPAAAPAISRDGRYVAYWGRNPNADALMLYDAATNAEPTLITTMGGQLGGPLVWSDDGSGLAFVTGRNGHPPGPATALRLWTLDLDAGRMSRPPRDITVADSLSAQLRPIAWIRETGQVSAIEGSPEGRALTYVLARDDGTSVERFALGTADQVTRLDELGVNEQTRVMSFKVTFTCQDGRSGCTVVRWWALEDPHLAVTSSQSGPGTDGGGYLGVAARPFEREFLVPVRRANGEEALQSLMPTGTYGIAGRGYGPFAKDFGFFVRPDGSAAFTFSFDGRWPGTIVDLGIGAIGPVDLTTNGGGSPWRSVTMDIGTAGAIRARPTVTPLLTKDEAIAGPLGKGVPGTTRVTARPIPFPTGGTTIDAWVVARAGTFIQETRGGLIETQPIQRSCLVTTIDARFGRLLAQVYGGDELCRPYFTN